MRARAAPKPRQQTFTPQPRAPVAAGMTAKPPAGAPPPTSTKPPINPNYATTPPPVTQQGAQIRSQATGTYSTAVNNYKNQLVQAALRLGSPDILNALLTNPSFKEYAGVLSQGMNDPGSTLSLLNTQETQGLQGVDEDFNKNNAFFSGYRLQDRGRMSDDFSNQRRGAVDEFRLGDQAGFNSSTAQALTDYHNAMNEALGIDTEAAIANEPEPEANKPKKPKKPKPKKKPRLNKPHGTAHQTPGHGNQNEGSGSTRPGDQKKKKKGKKQHYSPNTVSHGNGRIDRSV
jgi:hypothetical protein